MAFCIPKDQQKVFVDHFLKQVLDIALQLVDQGKDRGGPGETTQAVGMAVIRQILLLDGHQHEQGASDQNVDDDGSPGGES